MNEVQTKGKAAKQASILMGISSTEGKNDALAKISQQLLIDEEMILKENQKDIETGKEAGLTDAVLDRILLTKERLQDMSDAVSLLQELKDPIGEVLETIEKENGLHIEKKRVPLGVIGMIYEARPNVTVDAATLALKTGNAVLLRGSSSAAYSNQALVRSIHTALEESGLPKDAVLLLEDTSRETAKQLFQLKEYLDVLIPRGGKQLIDTVVREATVPVIETGAGNCHLYIDETADPDMALAIVMNAKTQRPSVCNSIETVILHKKWMELHGAKLISTLEANGVTLMGDEAAGVKPMGDVQWDEEFLGLTLRIKIVEDVQQAIAHIQQYGTKHSEGIVTDNPKAALFFMNHVDASAVYHNASTRFTDGFEFGYGAEIGISTQKLHARGPMGLQALTSSKFFITGSGQIRK